MSTVKVLLLDPKTVIYLFNLAVAASLVCGAGLLAARVCRRRPAPVRHGILVGTLALALLSPGAVWLGERNGLTWMQLAVSDQADPAGHSEVASAGASPGRVAVPSGPSASTGNERSSAAGPARTPSAASGVSAPGTLSPIAEAPSQGVLDAESSSFPPAAGRPSAVSSWQSIGTMLALGWLVGIFVQAIRLAWGYRVLGSLRSSLEEVAEPRVKALAQQAAAAVGRRDAPRVFRSPFAPAPFCLGLVRPVVVMPEEILRELDDGQLRDILIHETAHLARRDTWVSLAQRIAVVLFWWNVLVYRLRGRIADLREDICDNYVCRAQRETSRFAQTLVGLAARAATQHFAPATLGILEPTGLMGRVTRLLNKERNMATRMTLGSKVCVMAWTGMVFLAVVLAGGMRVANSAAAADEAAKIVIEIQPVPATGLHGQIVISPSNEAKPAEEPEKESAIATLRDGLLNPNGQSARRAIVGNWRAMSATMATADGGRSTVRDQGTAYGLGTVMLLVIYEKRLTMRAAGNVQIEASYTVDPKPDPATIDLKSADGDLLGLYKLDGDQLTLALNDAAKGRPKDLNDQSCGLRLTLNRREDFQIWMMNVDGTNPHPFVASPEYFAFGAPAWSPDGSKVAFDGGNSLIGGSLHLYVVDALGGNRKDLGIGTQSGWSPDGKRLAFCASAADRKGLCLIAPDGTGFEQLIPEAQRGRWSPVRDEIAYSRGADLYLYDLATKKERALIDEGYERISAGLNWSPDGEWLCFKGSTGGRWHMAVIHREGKEKGFRVVLSREARPDILDYDCNLCWLKPDGKRIVASVATEKYRYNQLYLIDPEGKVAPQLIPGQDSTRRLSMPASSPDGKRILFIRRPGQEPSPGFSSVPVLKSLVRSN